ncbi:MAG: hypothetical protein Q7J20_07945, partial [Candidatus Nitrotoga sp.]|nr:hypothetical protein [Candidatus Nitrotoga sp.]
KAQHQPAVHPSRISGAAAQEIVNTFLGVPPQIILDLWEASLAKHFSKYLLFVIFVTVVFD